MTKRMLIDCTHAEETRVVVLENNRLEDFDVETSTKKQLKGNIYLAKVVRVEPSLQAAFVEFGGGRHGFLAFGEIHPDYYQIPVADRRRLMEMQEAEAREEEEAEEREVARERANEAGDRPDRPDRNDRNDRGRRRGRRPAAEASRDDTGDDAAPEDPGSDTHDDPSFQPGDATEPTPAEPATDPTEPSAADALTETAYAMQADPEAAAAAMPAASQVAQPAAITQDILVAPEEAQAMFPDTAGSTGAALTDEPEATLPQDPSEPEPLAAAHAATDPATHAPTDDATHDGHDNHEEVPAPEQVGGAQDEADEHEEQDERRGTPRFLRNYKIQEVIRRRQILLVQVVKEERGTKGAALTTYISLAGRFSVLMPNSPRGGGISRKITSAADRRRLKEVMAELDLPRGMGLIVRTAGANRPKPEILRDGDYLLNQWDQIRDLTMKSMAPALIYEEASLIKRAIRDVYSRDVDDILVDGEEGWRAAHDFMRMLMPTHARKVQLWRDPQPLFAKAQVESQLDGMLHPTVQLRSGGYLVINQTEALVAIDVNSGRSTRERGIEETAVRTNLEAAEEAARQLRLRDLAGLIVIDFIDMESRRNNAAVEKRLKDALRHDRARIQVGSISHFGLLEMSRQRLRPSLTETTFVPCPHCGGTGHVRSTESAALHVLRAIEEEGAKRRAAEIVVHVAGSIAFYILNHKRVRLSEVEERFEFVVTFQADDSLLPPDMRIEKVRAQVASDAPAPVSQLAPPEPFEDPDEEIEAQSPPLPEPEDAGDAATEDSAPEPDTAAATPAATTETAEEAEARNRKRRRRRRGGRREDGTEAAPTDEAAAPTGEAAPAREAAVPTALDPTDATADPTAEPTSAGAEPGQPAPAVEGEDAEGERKRRSRRGGRRRRRGEPAPAGAEAEAEPEPEPFQPPAPEPKPLYAGPTPADPFGSNAFSFFDAVELDELPLRAPVNRPSNVQLGADTPPEPNPGSGHPPPAAPPPVAMPDEPAVVEATTVPEPAPPQAEPPVAETTEPPPAAPAPIIIDAEAAPPAEKKRGWWRR